MKYQFAPVLPVMRLLGVLYDPADYAVSERLVATAAHVLLLAPAVDVVPDPNHDPVDL